MQNENMPPIIPSPIELRLNNDYLFPNDRVVASYPKTGRTWLRFLLAHYINNLIGLSTKVDFESVYSIIPNTPSGQVPGQPDFMNQPGIPKVIFTHEMFNQEKYYPDQIVYITRDPRDVLVSNWFHRSLQLQKFDGSLQDFIRDEQWGIKSFVDHVDAWISVLGVERVLRYETMKQNTATALLKVCHLLSLPEDVKHADYAVKEASFERMRILESDHQVAGHDYNVKDPNARRVRAGKVGGFKEYMSTDDLRYITIIVKDRGGWARRLFSLN